MFNAISGFIKQYKIYAYLAVMVLAFIAGCALTYKVTLGTVAKLEAKIAILDASLTTCRSANEVNKKTIDRMSADQDAAAKTCEKQLSIERKKADKLRKIQETRGGNDAQGPEVDITDNGSTDGLLGALNGMLPAAGSGDAGGVCWAEDTGVSSGAKMVPGTIRYRFCSDQDVRNFMMNWELLWSRGEQCFAILDNLRSSQTVSAGQ